MLSLRAGYTVYPLGSTLVAQAVDITDWGDANLVIAHFINLGG
jgi:hypothetical protein